MNGQSGTRSDGQKDGWTDGLTYMDNRVKHLVDGWVIKRVDEFVFRNIDVQQNMW